MATTAQAAKVTCEIDKSLAAQVRAALQAMRVDHAQVQARRTVVLRERAALPFLPPTTRLEEDPIETCELFVPREQARAVALALARELRLFTPGRGAVYAENVELLGPAGFDLRNANLEARSAAEQPGERLAPLVLVNCVVQRGRGNEIARCALDMGANVPSVNFGVGTGVRDRLGLLRIAIPAEKEIVSLLVDPLDQDVTLEALIRAGRLDQPGRGFIGAYPVSCGIANPRGFRGQQRHSATMDQVIAAIDELRSGTEWRRRSGPAADAPRRWLTGLVNVTLNCNEGHADRLAAAAIASGAGGATITKTKYYSPRGGDLAASPAREVVDFGLAPARFEALMQALQAGAAFDDEVACYVETKLLAAAFTYVAG